MSTDIYALAKFKEIRVLLEEIERRVEALERLVKPDSTTNTGKDVYEGDENLNSADAIGNSVMIED